MNHESLQQHLHAEIALCEAKLKKTTSQKNKPLYELKLGYLHSLQRSYSGKATREDAMLADVVNDILQNQGVLDSEQTLRGSTKADAGAHDAFDQAPAGDGSAS